MPGPSAVASSQNAGSSLHVRQGGESVWRVRLLSPAPAPASQASSRPMQWAEATATTATTATTTDLKGKKRRRSASGSEDLEIHDKPGRSAHGVAGEGPDASQPERKRHHPGSRQDVGLQALATKPTESSNLNEHAAEKNLNLSRVALEHIRKELYNRERGDKSFNKVFLDPDPTKRMNEIQRVKRAADSLESIRSINVLNGDDASEYSRKIWELKSQTCDTLAHIAEDHIKALDPSATVGKLGISGMHTAAIIGPVPPAVVAQDFEHWPDHLVICDPWTKIACMAKDYPSAFMAKMEKWSKDNKAIVLNDGTPVSPLDERWTKLLKAPRYVYERRQGAEGQVDYKLVGSSSS